MESPEISAHIQELTVSVQVSFLNQDETVSSQDPALRVQTYIVISKKFIFSYWTTWTYRSTFFLCYFLPK